MDTEEKIRYWWMEGRPWRANPIDSHKLCRPYVLIAIQHPSAKDGRGIHSQPTLFESQPSHGTPISTLPMPAHLGACPRWDYSAHSPPRQCRTRIIHGPSIQKAAHGPSFAHMTAHGRIPRTKDHTRLLGDSKKKKHACWVSRFSQKEEEETHRACGVNISAFT